MDIIREMGIRDPETIDCSLNRLQALLKNSVTNKMAKKNLSNIKALDYFNVNSRELNAIIKGKYNGNIKKIIEIFHKCGMGLYTESCKIDQVPQRIIDKFLLKE